MIFIRRYEKDPDANTDLSIDLEDWLEGDTIASCSWSADSGITLGSNSITGDIITTFVSGGTEGIDYNVVGRVNTTNGREEDFLIIVTVGKIQYNTDVRKVRVLTGDTKLNDEMNSDEEIASFLEQEGTVRAAAAAALEAIAVKILMKMKKFKTIDLETDGPAVAKALQGLATQLREKEVTDMQGSFDLVPILATGFALDEYTFNQIINGEEI